MSEKATVAQTVYEVGALLITGVGLTLEPGVFLACAVFASIGSIVAKNHIEVLKTRRGFWLTLTTGLLFALTMLMIDQSASRAVEWWPDVMPQLIAISSGFFSPIAAPFLLKYFPRIAERLIGKYLPEDAGK